MDNKLISSDAITLDNQTTDPISLDSPQASTPVPQGIADTRAIKASTIPELGDQPVEQLSSTIANGNEPTLRGGLAASQELNNRVKSNQYLGQYLSDRAQDPNAGPLQQSDIQKYQDYANKHVEPQAVLEKGYAEHAMSMAINQDVNHAVTEGLNQTPDTIGDIIGRGGDFLATQQGVLKSYQDYNAQYQQNSVVSNGLEFLEGMLPFYDTTVMAGLHLGLPGNTIDEYRKNLFSMPPEQAIPQFNADMAKMWAWSKKDTMGFMHYVLQGTSDDKFWFNAARLGDIAAIVPYGTLGKVIKGGKELGAGAKAADAALSTSPAARVANMTKDIGKALGVEEPRGSEIIAATGDLEKATVLKTAEDTRAQVAAKDITGQFAATDEVTPLISSSPTKILKNLPDDTAVAASDLTQNLARSQTTLLRTLLQQAQSGASRLTAEQTVRGISAAYDQLRNTYTSIRDSITGMNWLRQDENIQKVNGIQVFLGKPDKTLFRNPDGMLARQQADYYAREHYGLPAGSYDIQPRGDGFEIRIVKALDETNDALREAEIETKHVIPDDFLNATIGNIRSADDILGVGHAENRKGVVHASQPTIKVLQDIAQKNIGNLPSKAKAELRRVYEANKDTFFKDQNGSENSTRGMFYKTVGDFNEGFRQLIGHNPTDKQTNAYFHAVMLNEYDWQLRNLNMYTAKARLGVQKTRFMFVPEEGKAQWTPTFDGKLVDGLPGGSEGHAGAYFWNSETGKGTYYQTNKMNAAAKDSINKAIEAGQYKVYQVGNALDHPLADAVSNRNTIHYIIARDVEQTPLDFKQIPYQPGSNTISKNKFFTKQPIIKTGSDGKMTYYGDASVMSHGSRAEATRYSNAMTKATNMLKNNDPKLGDYLSKNLPWDAESFGKLFADGKLSVDHPFQSVRSGENTNDPLRSYFDNNKIQDETNNPHYLYKSIEQGFISHKDPNAFQTVREGTGLSEDSPLFQLNSARTLDPMQTLNRSLNDVVHSRIFSDYKIYSAENFIKQFRDLLGASTDRLNANPMAALVNPDWKVPSTGNDYRLKIAKNAQKSIMNLIGQETPMQRSINALKENMLSSIYTNHGQAWANWADDWLMPRIGDPFQFMRQIAFHTKLGLFNPVQALKQGVTMAHTIAIAGIQHAVPATAGAFLMRAGMGTENEAVLKGLSNVASKFGWTPESFTDMVSHFKLTGKYYVEGEHAFNDMVTDPQLFTSGFSRFLDKGELFFRGGERWTRMVAWATAYREFKAANPLYEIGLRERNVILNRSDNLTQNMTRASMANAQKGIFAVPTQFLGYQWRMMEQLLPFVGKRLTTGEKMRMFTMNSALYGVPTAVGAMTAIYPWYEDVRQAALENQVNLDNPAIDAFHSGLLNVASRFITGKEMDMNSDLGPGGSSLAKDVLSGKKNALDLVFGASGSIANTIISSAHPLLQDIQDLVTGNNPGYRPLAQDFIDVSKNISSLNQAEKTLFAINTGKYMTKSDEPQSDIAPWQAIYSGITGAVPQEVNDAFLKFDSIKNLSSLQAQVKKDAFKYFRRGMDADNLVDQQDNFRKFTALLQGGGFMPNQSQQLMREAFQSMSNLSDTANYSFQRKILNDNSGATQ